MRGKYYSGQQLHTKTSGCDHPQDAARASSLQVHAWLNHTCVASPSHHAAAPQRRRAAAARCYQSAPQSDGQWNSPFAPAISTKASNRLAAVPMYTPG